MSQQHLETIQRALSAFLARDAEAFADCFAEEADLRLPRNLLEGGGYAGREGARRAIADAYETWADIRITIESIREIGDQVLVATRVTNVGRPGTPSIEYEGAHLVRLRDGQIVHWRPYQSQREALEAAGLSPG
jgi:ketosteroid isomerase-like protein